MQPNGFFHATYVVEVVDESLSVQPHGSFPATYSSGDVRLHVETLVNQPVAFPDTSSRKSSMEVAVLACGKSGTMATSMLLLLLEVSVSVSLCLTLICLCPVRPSAGQMQGALSWEYPLTCPVRPSGQMQMHAHAEVSRCTLVP